MFQCTKCGYCCRSLKGIQLFQSLDRGDGTCKYLDDESNLCKIYETRPLLCRVDESYSVFFSTLMSRNDYEALNYKACADLQKRFEKNHSEPVQ